MQTEYKGEWISDYSMLELVGAWWDEEMLLDEGWGSNNKQHWLNTANAELRKRGYTIEMIDVRDAGDELEWLAL